MANAVVARFEYAEGGAMSVTVQVEGGWPDGLDEARRHAVRGLREAMADDVAEAEADDALAHLDTEHDTDDGEG